MHDRRPRLLPAAATLLLPLAASLALAACGAASASPNPPPSARPTPTPIIAPVTSPADAAAIVIASDPRFAGVTQLRPDIIGASKWWKSETLATGGYRVEVTIGWGDCQAGCIERHVWTFDVSATGGLTLVSETGDPLPSDLPA